VGHINPKIDKNECELCLEGYALKAASWKNNRICMETSAEKCKAMTEKGKCEECPPGSHFTKDSGCKSDSPDTYWDFLRG
jgi:hypothetical protein